MLFLSHLCGEEAVNEATVLGNLFLSHLCGEEEKSFLYAAY